MKYKGFVKIVVGLLFAFLSIRIMGFDIIPDPIGYLLIMLGFLSLAPTHTDFRKAVPFVIGSLIFGLIDVVISLQTGGQNIPIDNASTGEIVMVSVISTLEGICTIAFLWLLGKGMGDLLNDKNFSNEARITKNCIIANIVVVVMTCLPFVLFFMAISLLSISFIIIGFAFAIWLMIRVYRNYVVLKQSETIAAEAHEVSNISEDDSQQ